MSKHRKTLSLKTRYRVMKRDNFTCRACGASRHDNATLKLEIDHVVPLAAGGTDKEENLQVLCVPCNAGKSNDSATHEPTLQEKVAAHPLMARKRHLELVAEPVDIAATKFTPTAKQHRFREIVRRCSAQGLTTFEEWTGTYLLEFNEEVRAPEYDRWFGLPGFEEWFSEGIVRRRSLPELAAARREAERRLAELLSSENEAIALGAAKTILTQTDRVDPVKDKKGGKEQSAADKHRQAQAELVAALRREA